jgi:hypothetical protein
MIRTIIPIRGILNNRIKRFFKLGKVAKERKLRFSAIDEVGNNLLAIDTTQNTLVYLKHKTATSSCLLIDVNNLKECTIEKKYAAINAGELNRKSISAFLKSIFLKLRFKNTSATIKVPFYDADDRRQVDVEQLEAKARKWALIVSGVMPLKRLESA